jgi:transposase
LAGLKIMMGHRQVEQAALFYEFSLEKHIPANHLLRSIDRFVDLEQVRRDLAPFYSSIGRPSIDPELIIAASPLPKRSRRSDPMDCPF